MNKDIIYIDIEDDITAIIGKVKAASNKIVALVPPKRVGVLQSAVNLKLLQKAAKAGDKRVVLITSDHSLMALAAGLSLPVARNLQSRPEIPKMDMPEAPTEEVINGQDLPVGEVAAAMDDGKADAQSDASLADSIGDKVTLGGAALKNSDKSAGAMGGAAGAVGKAKKGLSSALNKGKNKLNIPDFDSFRNKVFIGGALGVVLVAFLVWAFVFAPHATVTIAAKTTDVIIDRTLTLLPTAASSDPTNLNLKPNVQQLKKEVATEFEATGTKDVGKAAAGSVTVRNCDYAAGELSLPTGTRFTGANGKVYLSTKAVDVPGRIPPGSTCTLGGPQSGKVDVPVQAQAIGDEYNVCGQGYTLNVAGKIDATDAEGMTGGTHENVTIVTQEDVDKAKQQLAQANSDDAKTELKKQFTKDDLVIEESFAADTAAPTPDPAVGSQATQAKLTVETTYTLVAITRSDVRAILKAAIDDTLKDKPNQQMYTLGENSIKFQEYAKTDKGFAVKLDTAGSIGPKIDTDALAKQLVGKRYGEIQAITDEIPGVDHVDITLSPFWVNTAPSADKIDIKFSVAPRQ